MPSGSGCDAESKAGTQGVYRDKFARRAEVHVRNNGKRGPVADNTSN